jgi:hypothetical protein
MPHDMALSGGNMTLPRARAEPGMARSGAEDRKADHGEEPNSKVAVNMPFHCLRS